MPIALLWGPDCHWLLSMLLDVKQAPCYIRDRGPDWLVQMFQTSYKRPDWAGLGVPNQLQRT